MSNLGTGTILCQKRINLFVKIFGKELIKMCIHHIYDI